MLQISNICEYSCRFQSLNDRKPIQIITMIIRMILLLMLLTMMTSTAMMITLDCNARHCTVLLMLASQRIESVIGNWFWGVVSNAGQNQSSIDIEESTTMNQKRGATPSAIEWMILAWVSQSRNLSVK